MRDSYTTWRKDCPCGGWMLYVDGLVPEIGSFRDDIVREKHMYRCRAERPPLIERMLEEAEASIAMVRALHRLRGFHIPGIPDDECIHCGRRWPCPTIQALDGQGSES